MKIRFLIIMCSLSISAECTAEINEIVSVPTDWRVDSTSDGGIQAYYTGSTCAHGKIKISYTANSDFKNRFWSLMMMGKSAKTKVQVFYDDGLDCEVISFVIPRDSEALVP